MMTKLRSMSKKASGQNARSDTPPGMIWIPGGTFEMGSDAHYPEEAPVHRVRVDSFWIDATPITNRQFQKFVRATGHVTFAEVPPDPKDYPGALPHMLYAGSLVFTPPLHPIDLRNWGEWWRFVKGADWKHPYGPQSTINELLNHPVVHIAYSDARGDCRDASLDPAQRNIKIPRKVVKGGSHLCAPNYCRRYRPAARQPEAIDSSTSHIGFRCIIRQKSPASAGARMEEQSCEAVK